MLRQNVGAVIVDKYNKIYLFKSNHYPYPVWQCPQGGVENNEDELETILREIEEETGITSLSFIKKMDKKTKYLFDDDLKKKLKDIRGWDFEGQEQTWFLFRFTGFSDEINFHYEDKEAEFCDYKKVPPSDMHLGVKTSKVATYKEVAKYFFG